MEDPAELKKETPLSWNRIARIVTLVFLVAILTLFLFLFRTTEQVGAHDPINVGLARTPSAFCSCVLLGSPNANYTTTLFENEDQLADAFRKRTIDAALLPTRYLAAIQDEPNQVVALTSSLNLIAVENGGSASTMADLAGRTVLAPESLRLAPEMVMFSTLIAKSQASVQITFESDQAIQQRATDGSFNVLMLTVEQGASVLLMNDRYHSCFNLSKQWEDILGTQPPAGCCVVMRTALTAEKAAHMNGFLTDLEASLAFTNQKHAKASEVIIATGLGKDLALIRKMISHCVFSFHKGSKMAEALVQWYGLTS